MTNARVVATDADPPRAITRLTSFVADLHTYGEIRRQMCTCSPRHPRCGWCDEPDTELDAAILARRRLQAKAYYSIPEELRAALAEAKQRERRARRDAEREAKP